VSWFIVININIVIVGAVPVIVVLTKADALEHVAIDQLRDMGLTMREALPMVNEVAAEVLSKLRARIELQLSRCKYPPKAYISTASKYSLSFFLG